MFLNFNIEILEHPYADQRSSVFEQWGKIKLELSNDGGETERVVFDIQWDVKVFISWLIENQPHLLDEEYPLLLRESSIAEAVYRFYESLDLETDSKSQEALLSLIYNYRTRHSLRFAMRGTDIDDVFIGQVNGETTISCFNEFSNWNYKVEIGRVLSIARALSEKLF